MTEKSCLACETQLDLSYFYRDAHAKDGHKARCKPCENAGRVSAQREARRRQHEQGVRTCKTCQVTKPLSEYFKTAHRDPSGIPRHRTSCKACHQHYTNEWRKRNAEKLSLRRAASNLKRYRKLRLQKYGLSDAELTEMEQRADGVCSICERQVERLVIDHCHSTGLVRSLICSPCNQGLGLFRESPETLTRAIEYLMAHSK